MTTAVICQGFTVWPGWLTFYQLYRDVTCFSIFKDFDALSFSSPAVVHSMCMELSTDFDLLSTNNSTCSIICCPSRSISIYNIPYICLIVTDDGRCITQLYREFGPQILMLILLQNIDYSNLSNFMIILCKRSIIVNMFLTRQ